MRTIVLLLIETEPACREKTNPTTGTASKQLSPEIGKNVLHSAQKTIEELLQEQARLEELLFLVDRDRRARVQKMLSHLREQIAGLHAIQTQAEITTPKSLEQLRQQQSDLEETLFREPPERRPEIKRLLAAVRREIAAALDKVTSDQHKDGPQVA